VRNRELYRMILIALFTAFVAVATMVITVPMPGVMGYVNVGDTLIFVTALILGAKAGLIAGGLGSAFADILLGYTHWAPWTLVVKGIEGLLVGLIGHRSFVDNEKLTVKSFTALIVGALWMVLGYFLSGSVVVGYAPALGGIPGDLTQGFSSVIFSIPLLYLLISIFKKARFSEIINDKISD